MDAFIFFFRFSASQNERKKKTKEKRDPFFLKRFTKNQGN